MAELSNAPAGSDIGCQAMYVGCASRARLTLRATVAHRPLVEWDWAQCYARNRPRRGSVRVWNGHND